jgi:hypothetical protein
LRWFCWFGALQEAYRRAQVASLGGLKQMFAPANAKTPEPRK